LKQKVEVRPMTYFDRQTDIPCEYQEAAAFASSTDSLFKFGRPLPSLEKAQRIVNEGYKLNMIDNNSRESERDSVLRSMWHYGTSPQESYAKMTLHAQDSPFYIVFGIPQEFMQGSRRDIESMLQDDDLARIIPDKYKKDDNRKLWGYSVDTYAAMNGSKLPKETVLGYVSMRDGKVVDVKMPKVVF
jgi:hypothetical protein